MLQEQSTDAFLKITSYHLYIVPGRMGQVKFGVATIVWSKVWKYRPRPCKELQSVRNMVPNDISCSTAVTHASFSSEFVLTTFPLKSCMMASSNGPFSALLGICAGNSPFPVNSLHKSQWRGALMFSLICVWINGCVNNREAGDLRYHRVHYDSIMTSL